MRIIGGEFKRRRLHTPRDASTTRPMPDLVRQAVFNLLRGHFEGEAVLDAFSGTGAIGLEAVSRGAARVVLIEKDRRIAKLVEQNIEDLGCADRAELVVGDALGPAALMRCPDPVHIIFLDPPYPLVRDPDGWERFVRQFERLIAKLDDTGYAVLRTPWPFFHEAPAPPPEPEVDESVVYDLDRDGPLDAEGIEALANEPDNEAPVQEHDQPPPKTPVDLNFSFAVGPETHIYGKSAVHLYMKRPPADRGTEERDE
ncbi:MAG: RsmD family RNA methyltransferase [Phycisphaerales bacterium]|nr:RsmD family RNA methyltransferase [Phycisphaerales bacterium]